jgi:hypothetical protein
MQYLSFAFLVVMTALRSPAEYCDKINRGASEAAFVDAYSPDSNFGGDDQLHVRGPGARERRGLVKWDLSAIPADAVVTNASISFTLSTSGITTTGSGTLWLREVISFWTEGDETCGVTWNTQPVMDNSDLDAVSFDPVNDVPESTVYTFSGSDVMDLVQRWIDGTATNNGIAVLSNNGSGIVKLYSDEQSMMNLRPFLKIDCYFPSIQMMVTSSVGSVTGFPLSHAVDGNPETIAFLQGEDTAEEVEQEGANGSFIFEFVSLPQTVNRIRFKQSAYAFAQDYSIYADTTDDGQFDTFLAAEAQGRGLYGKWIEHQFDSTNVYRIKLEGISGLAMDYYRYPGVAEFEAYLSDKPRTETNEQVCITVDTTEKYSVNGVSEVHDEMFGIGAAVGNLDDQDIYNYIESLNLGMLSFWSPRLLANDLIPEDTNNPGCFDRQYFTSGQFKEEVLDQYEVMFGLVDELGLRADYRLMGAPPYMQDTNFTPVVDPSLIPDGYWPPKDSAEWGEMAAYVMEAVCSNFPAVKEVHVWNEPNGILRLPVKFDDKLPRYMDLYTNAAPIIKSRVPQLDVGGPVLTGGGLVGWRNYDPKGFEWLAQMLDNGGDPFDFVDVHMYTWDVPNMKSQGQLYANYSLLSRGEVIPVMSSEGSWFNAARNLLSQSLNRPYYLLASQWALNVRNVGNLLLNMLQYPDRFHGFSYFYMQQNSYNNDTDADHMFFNEDDDPNPIYWFYWALRDLRGERLQVSNPDDDLNVISALNDGQSVTVIQNTGGKYKELDIGLYLPLGCQSASARVDYVECDLSTNQLYHGSEWLPIQDNVVHLTVEPLGVYAVVIDGIDPVLSRVMLKNEYFGNRVFAELGEGVQTNIQIQVPAGADDDARTVYLQYGLVGEFSSTSPYLMAEGQLPMTVTVNGSSYEQIASKFNELILTNSLQATNTITFQYRPEDGNAELCPTQLWVMAASIAIEKEALCSNIYTETSTYIDVYNPDSNYGDNNEVHVRGSGTRERWGLVSWDLNAIPTNSTVMDVRISCTLSSSGVTTASSGNLWLREVTSSWDEGDGSSGVTWNSKPATNGLNLAVASFNPSDSPETTVYNFSGTNLVNLVQGWVDGTSTNNGIAILSNNGSGIVKLYSDDESEESCRPLLSVTYTTPCE